MELGYSFLGLIVSIGVIHLATVAGQYFSGLCSRWSKGTTKNLASVSGERDDWYVFFHCADLLGKEANSHSTRKTKQDQPADTVPNRRERSVPVRRRARL